jgi:hypothetical protein
MLSTSYYDSQVDVECFFYRRKSNHQNQQVNHPKDSQHQVV